MSSQNAGSILLCSFLFQRELAEKQQSRRTKRRTSDLVQAQRNLTYPVEHVAALWELVLRSDEWRSLRKRPVGSVRVACHNNCLSMCSTCMQLGSFKLEHWYVVRI